MMLKRKRKYRCKHCGTVCLRVSDKQWIKSDCVANNDRPVHLMLVPPQGKKATESV